MALPVVTSKFCTEVSNECGWLEGPRACSLAPLYLVQILGFIPELVEMFFHCLVCLRRNKSQVEGEAGRRLGETERHGWERRSEGEQAGAEGL